MAGALADAAEVARRRAMLTAPHMRALADYVCALNAQDRGWAPDFDPLDGGVQARLLLLLEKPGPGLHSGFVSRDNNTPTAAAIRVNLEQARVPRCFTLIWNVIPWWNGTMTVRAAERRTGAAALGPLLRLLPALRCVVLADASAQRAAPALHDHGLHVFTCVHPSPNARAGPASAAAWRELPRIWNDAWEKAAT